MLLSWYLTLGVRLLLYYTLLFFPSPSSSSSYIILLLCSSTLDLFLLFSSSFLPTLPISSVFIYSLPSPLLIISYVSVFIVGYLYIILFYLLLSPLPFHLPSIIHPKYSIPSLPSNIHSIRVGVYLFSFIF